MKVLIVHTSYKYHGGEDTVVAEEMELLKFNGITVELLQFNNNNNSLSKILQLPFNLFSYIRTRKKLKSFPADVVHIHNLHFGASASVMYAINNLKIPFVMTLHNYRLLCPSATLSSKGKLYLASIKQRFPWNAIAQRVYKNSALLTFWVALSMKLHQQIGTWKLCRRYIVLSQHAEKLFLESTIKFPTDKLTVKPNFCNAPLFSEPLTTGYFLYVGRLIEEKGTRLLLNVFASCGYTVKIAGDGPLKDEVIRYSAQFPNIEFLGSVKKEEVFSLLSNCSALIFPSTWYEGMPLTIIEAFACGTPVISSKMGAMENMITHNYNGLHFEPSNEADLIGKLEEWLSFTKEVKGIYRKNARATYEKHYTPEKNFDQLMAVYNSVIDEKKALLGMYLSTGAYKEFVDSIIALSREKKGNYVCVANVHMLIETYDNPEFATVVNNADLITPDGKPLTWGLRMFYNISQDRVAGMDLLPDLLHQAADKNLPVFFYGGTEALLSQTKRFITCRYPSLQIAGLYSPPFRKMTTAEELAIAEQINDTGARLVFVVLGCPKQEKWMAGMKGKINAVMIGVGGALPVLVGLQKRAPDWMQKTGFEWLFRFVQEPKRLFKRYAVTNTQFIYLLTKELLKVRLLKRKPVPI